MSGDPFVGNAIGCQSASSLRVGIGRSQDPRTRHPGTFTASYPHRDSGMKNGDVERSTEREWSRPARQGSAQAVRVRNVSGRFWGQLLGETIRDGGSVRGDGERVGKRCCSNRGGE